MFLDTLKATTIYFVEWFIISASLFPRVKEQIHSSLLSPDYHSLAAAPCLSVTSSLLSSTLSPPSRPYPPRGSLPSSVPSVPPFTLHHCLFSSSTSGTLSRTSCQRCGFVAEPLKQMLCFCVKHRNVLPFFCGNDITSQSEHMFILYLSPSHFSWAQSVDEMNSCWHSCWLFICICFISRLIRATKPSENTVILAVVPQKWVWFYLLQILISSVL